MATQEGCLKLDLLKTLRDVLSIPFKDLTVALNLIPTYGFCSHRGAATVHTEGQQV